VPTATVTVTVDGAVTTFVATGGTQAVDVAPLAANAIVVARQTDGVETTPDSPPVVVEDVTLPPAAAPLLPSEVGQCSECVRLEGLVPGCDVEIVQNGVTVGKGKADRSGAACVGVTLDRIKDEGAVLTARMIVCNQAGPFGGTPIVTDQPLGVPGIETPIFGCQSLIGLRGLHRGARTRVDAQDGTFFGQICNCFSNVNVWLLHAMQPGQLVFAQQYWDGAICKTTGPPSGPVLVEAPDERIRPDVEPALVEGDQVIRVANQIGGAQIVVLIRDDEMAPTVRYGPRLASEEIEVALNGPLVAGQQVAAEQTLCGHVETSDWVTVLPRPAVIARPVVVGPLHPCAGAVAVTGLHAGALVRVFADGIPCGLAWAGDGPSVRVNVAPTLVAGNKVTAIQTVGGVASLPSDSVLVEDIKEVHRPRIIGPVAFGDTEVLVSGVTPGSLVIVRSGGVLLGEGFSAEPVVRVGVAPIPGAVTPSSRLCERLATGASVEPITTPTAPGTEAGAGEADLTLGTYSVPTEVDPTRNETDGGFAMPLVGRLYHPADGDGNLPDHVRSRPLVLIAHGLWQYLDPPSYVGYAALARHLARWGYVVFSIDMQPVNDQVGSFSSGPTQQTARAAVILEVADRLRQHSTWGRVIDPARVALVGHSMSGEAVAIAATRNRQTSGPVRVRAAVSIAPTNWRPDIALEGGGYLQLHGTHDYLLSNSATGQPAPFGGFRVYDRAYRTRSHVHVPFATHPGWNTEWFASNPSPPPTLTPDDQATIARAFVTAFVQDLLVGATGYRGYLQGAVVPQAVRSYNVVVQHHQPGVVVVDDFGDDDPVLGTPEDPIDKTVNRPGGVVLASGAGLDTWEDVESVSIAHALQDTRTSDLAWHVGGAAYRSALPVPPMVNAASNLSIRLAQRYDETAGAPDETWNPIGGDLDCLVSLEGAGAAATVRLGSIAAVPYPAPSAAPKISYRTILLPMDAFTAANPALNPGAITAVTLQLVGRPTGRLLVDDIELLP
jgi:dienelactone hydrolase